MADTPAPSPEPIDAIRYAIEHLGPTHAVQRIRDILGDADAIGKDLGRGAPPPEPALPFHERADARQRHCEHGYQHNGLRCINCTCDEGVAIVAELAAADARLRQLQEEHAREQQVFIAVEDVLAKHCRGFMDRPTTRENIAELIDRICTTSSRYQYEKQAAEARLRLLQDAAEELDQKLARTDLCWKQEAEQDARYIETLKARLDAAEAARDAASRELEELKRQQACEWRLWAQDAANHLDEQAMLRGERDAALHQITALRKLVGHWRGRRKHLRAASMRNTVKGNQDHSIRLDLQAWVLEKCANELEAVLAETPITAHAPQIDQETP